jgi:hypothetical protein
MIGRLAAKRLASIDWWMWLEFLMILSEFHRPQVFDLKYPSEMCFLLQAW